MSKIPFNRDPAWISQKYAINRLAIQRIEDENWYNTFHISKVVLRPMQIIKLFDDVKPIEKHYARDSIELRKIVTTVSVKNNSCLACWDTGFVDCGISASFARKLHLTPLNNSALLSTANGAKETKLYLINIDLGNGIVVLDALADEVDIDEDDEFGVKLLIGMNVISKGNFILKQKKDEIFFSFDLN